MTEAELPDDQDLLIEGYANKAVKDRVGDIVIPSAFEEAIKTYLDSPILLYMHDKSKPIGAITDVVLEAEGIKVAGYISGASKFAREEVMPLVKKKILNSFSIGFIPKEGKYEPKSESYIITKGELLEISVVSVAANQESKFSLVKEFTEGDEFTDLRNSWRTKALTDETTIIEEKKSMDKLQELEARLTKALEDMESQKGALGAKDTQIEALAKKAAELDKIKELEAKKALEELEAKKLMERTEMQKGFSELQESIKALKTELETAKADVEEAKAIATKASNVGRIEFPAAKATAEMWKDFGGELDDLYLASSLLRKDFKEISIFNRLPDQVKSVVYTDDPGSAFKTQIGTRFMEDIRGNSTLMTLFPSMQLPTENYVLPYDATSLTATWVDAGATQTPDNNALTINPVAFKPKKLMAKLSWQYEEEADALLPVLPQIRMRLAEAMADALDAAVWTGNGTPFYGIEAYAAGGSLNTTVADKASLVSQDVSNARLPMGKYGYKNTDTVLCVNYNKYGQLVDDTNVVTIDKFGALATIHKGELARVWGMPIVVSDAVTGVDSTNGYAGMIVHTPSFMFGWRNNIVIESDRNVENQTKVIVFTLRADFKTIYPTTGASLVQKVIRGLKNPIS